MRTYAGRVSDWFNEVKRYGGYKTEWRADAGVQWALFNWKYTSRVMVLDINETIRIFYLVDFPRWLEPACYLVGLALNIAIFLFVVSAQIPPLSLLTFLSSYLCIMIVTGRPDFLACFIGALLELCADAWYRSAPRQKIGGTRIGLEDLKDKTRCRYFAWTIINVHGGNNQLNSAIKESNEIIKNLGLDFRVGMDV